MIAHHQNSQTQVRHHMDYTDILTALAMGAIAGVIAGILVALLLKWTLGRQRRAINALNNWLHALDHDLSTHSHVATIEQHEDGSHTIHLNHDHHRDCDGHPTRTLATPTPGSRLIRPDHPIHDQGHQDDPPGVSWTQQENTAQCKGDPDGNPYTHTCQESGTINCDACAYQPHVAPPEHTP